MTTQQQEDYGLYSNYLKIRKNVLSDMNFHVLCCAVDLERRNKERFYLACTLCEELETCVLKGGLYFR